MIVSNSLLFLQLNEPESMLDHDLDLVMLTDAQALPYPARQVCKCNLKHS